jgi:hypothetical protein
MNDNKSTNIAKQFDCEICNYTTLKKSNFFRHLTCKLHKKNKKIQDDDNIAKQYDNNIIKQEDKKFICKCGNSYKYSQGLSKHKKQCNYKTTEEKYNELIEEHKKQLYLQDKKIEELQNKINNSNKLESYPINNQLINIIVDKSKKIEELKNKIDRNETDSSNNEEKYTEINEIVDIKIIEEQKKEIKMRDDKIKVLENAYIKKQHRKNYPDENVIYLISTDDNKKKRIYIIGKARNLKNRLSTYNKSAEHEVIYYKTCNTEENMNIIELMILKK